MRKRLPRVDEHGVTMTEVLVTVLLLSIVIAMALPALLSGFNVMQHTDDDTRGLADVRTIVERMSRDIRAASRVEAGPSPFDSTGSKLVIWVDGNADYRRSAGEIITWRFALQGAQYDVIRETDSGGATVVGQTVVPDVNNVFTYAPAPPDTRRVTVKIDYDAVPGAHASTKDAGFVIRLRNAE